MKVEEREELVEKNEGVMTVKRVFGEPITSDGLTLIPVAKVRGAGGGGSGESETGPGKGWGAGYAATAEGIGTYVIKGQSVRFVPVVDVVRVMRMTALVVLGVLFLFRPRLRR